MKQSTRLKIVSIAWHIAMIIGIGFLLTFLFRVQPMPSIIAKVLVAIEIAMIIVIMVLDNE